MLSNSARLIAAFFKYRRSLNYYGNHPNVKDCCRRDLKTTKLRRRRIVVSYQYECDEWDEFVHKVFCVFKFTSSVRVHASTGVCFSILHRNLEMLIDNNSLVMLLLFVQMVPSTIDIHGHSLCQPIES